MKHFIFLAFLFIVYSGCQKDSKTMDRTFRDDIAFLQKHTDALVLQEPDGKGQVIVVPQYQARIMTSTLSGEEGAGFGWINYDHIASGIVDDRFNAYGGEDRFWLGPEGGQFSLYHKAGGPFDLDNWFVPKQIDTQPFIVDGSSDRHVKMSSDFSISNYSGFDFKIHIDRTIRIFTTDEISGNLGIKNFDHCDLVGFESVNVMTNTGDESWNKTTGLLSIWILGMYNPGENVVIALPYYQGGVGSLGEVVNADYFGEIPSDRLRSSQGIVYFSGDGKFRSKIGLNWMRAKKTFGSYDPDRKVLTIIKYNKPEKEADYIKAKWEIMDDPYNGDVVNSYNDGSPGPGKEALGPFYELETSSPVQELEPGNKIEHIHQTYHIQGAANELSHITEKLFNVTIQEIQDAFKHL